MFINKTWIENRLTDLRNWLMDWTRDYVANELQALQRNASVSVSYSATAAESAEGLSKDSMGSAKPECGCGGCTKYRNEPLNLLLERYSRAFWAKEDKLEDGTTPWCWGKRIEQLEQQHKALMAHLGLVALPVPESTTEAHYKIEPVELMVEIPMKARRAGLTTKAKQARRRSKG